MKHKIICGKSEEELKQFDDNFFDSCVTDPPYGLEFMGKDWDKFKTSEKKRFGEAGTEGNKDLKLKKNFKILPRFFTSDLFAFQEFTYRWAIELYRVMKPGAFILVFGGTRTYHRMACAIEDAGFEVRDMIEWFYGSGFPKSLDISKAIDKLKNAKRKVVGKGVSGKKNTHVSSLNMSQVKDNTFGDEYDITEPASPEAILWNDWGTSLKPAHEPILLARKPISEKNIASNVLKWRTGGLNIESCRVGLKGGTKSKGKGSESVICYGDGLNATGVEPIDKGRFPANLILECCCENDELIEGEAGGSQGHWSRTKTSGFDEFGGGKSEYNGVGEKDNMKCLIHANPNCMCKMLDEQSGELTSGEMDSIAKGGQFAVYGNQYPRKTISHKSKGGASRFYYQAKASQKEKWFYCTICKEAFQMKEKDNHVHGAPKKIKYKYLEFHPTQKPEKLIEYLMKFITPSNGTVLEPFMGTGTALIAAEREGFNSIGIDNKSEYCLMSYRRLEDEILQQTKLIGELSTIEKEGF